MIFVLAVVATQTLLIEGVSHVWHQHDTCDYIELCHCLKIV